MENDVKKGNQGPQADATSAATVAIVSRAFWVAIAVVLYSKLNDFAGMPSQKFTKSDGSLSYTTSIEFTNRAAADRFRDLAIAALRELGVTE